MFLCELMCCDGLLFCPQLFLILRIPGISNTNKDKAENKWMINISCSNIASQRKRKKVKLSTITALHWTMEYIVCLIISTCLLKAIFTGPQAFHSTPLHSSYSITSRVSQEAALIFSGILLPAHSAQLLMYGGSRDTKAFHVLWNNFQELK